MLLFCTMPDRYRVKHGVCKNVHMETSSFLASTIAWLGCLGTVCLVSETTPLEIVSATVKSSRPKTGSQSVI